MKAIKQIILLFLMVAIFGGLKGQEYIYFSGQITEFETDYPIPFYPVMISEGDSLPLSFTETNQAGYYFDSVYNNPSGFGEGIVVSTPDCNGMVQSILFEEPDTFNVANFEICVIGDSCQAYYLYETDIYDPYTIHFTDLSIGQFTDWYWDFGDGTFSNEQNPSHPFNSPGMFEVCLTVTDSMQMCVSIWCDYVYVGETECSADFSWYPDDENPLTINFEDQSAGEIDFWFWDFGDGNESTMQSPSHNYAESGEYLVTLFILDSMEICSSYAEQWIFVVGGNDCQAAFTAELDTLSNTPFVYYFENTSIGNYSNTLWDFGDGNYSEENSPSHTYMEGGSYQVCLQIFSQDSSYCQDFFCDIIETPQYFNFGGHAFLGDFPLNVEDNDSSNIAVASLFRRINNQWELMDTREFWKFGYYWFAEKPEGEYIIRADLLSSADEFGNYSPTYLPDIRFWENAETFTLSNSEEFAVDIYLREMAIKASGIGEISGIIWSGGTCAEDINVSGELVYLLNSDYEIVDYTYTDVEGYFVFGSLGYGTYHIRAEVTGKTSSVYDLVLESSHPDQNGIELEVGCNGFVNIEEAISTDVARLNKVYPMPADDRLSVELESSTELQLNYSLININGSVVLSGNVNGFIGKKTIELDLKLIQSGLYLLRFNDVNGLFSETKKIIVN